MIQTFLTLEEAAEKLKDRGYTYELIQAAVAAGRIPYHIRDLTIYIPFPEADEHFPPVFPEPAPELPAEPESRKAPKRAIKKPKV